MKHILSHSLLPLVKSANRGLRDLVSRTHKLQYRMQWRYANEHPEWFDHFLDHYWQWRAKEVSHWLERGVFGLLAIKPGASVLELCCGDGFNARNFYAARASKILSTDFDETAIAHAKQNNSHPKVAFVLSDIRTDMPAGQFDNVVWDAAIEHFTQDEIRSILGGIRDRLKPGGVLSGYTIVERADGRKQLHQHEYEFKDKQDLLDILKPYFDNVVVFETIHKGRHNLYFFCSDGPVPLGSDWDASVISETSVSTPEHRQLSA